MGKKRTGSEEADANTERRARHSLDGTQARPLRLWLKLDLTPL
jgi:hypothetical protein